MAIEIYLQFFLAKQYTHSFKHKEIWMDPRTKLHSQIIPKKYYNYSSANLKNLSIIRYFDVEYLMC